MSFNISVSFVYSLDENNRIAVFMLMNHKFSGHLKQLIGKTDIFASENSNQLKYIMTTNNKPEEKNVKINEKLIETSTTEPIPSIWYN